MKKSIAILILLTIIISTFFLSGCIHLYDEKQFIKDVETVIPNAQFVSMEVKTIDNSYYNNNNETQNVYTFTNGEFQFQIINRLETNCGATHNIVESDYPLKVYEVKQAEIDAILDEFDVTLINDSFLYDMDLSNMNACGIELYNGEIQISFSIDKKEDIDTWIAFLNRIKEVVKDYLPKEENKRVYFKTEIDLYTEFPFTKQKGQPNEYETTSMDLQHYGVLTITPNINFDEMRDYAYHLYGYFIEGVLDDWEY